MLIGVLLVNTQACTLHAAHIACSYSTHQRGLDVYIGVIAANRVFVNVSMPLLAHTWRDAVLQALAYNMHTQGQSARLVHIPLERRSGNTWPAK